MLMSRRTYGATLAELTSLEEMMRTLMQDGGVHPDVVNKLWQVYSESIALPMLPILTNRYGPGDTQASTTRSDHRPGYAGCREARSGHRASRVTAQDRTRTTRNGKCAVTRWTTHTDGRTISYLPDIPL